MNSLFYNTCKIFALSLLLLTPCLSVAAESKAQEASIEGDWTSVPFLPTVTVEATRLDPLTGKSTLDRDQIESIPSRNSNTSDLLKLMPGVQMPESAESSNTAGEIAPAAVSISGGRPYDNNFLIDGVGNNSLLDPQYDNQSNINNVPGHPQELFLLNNLVQELTVLRSNISARYGGFTGGVIDVKTIDPTDEFSGSISYRATDSDWSKFHVDPNQQDDFDNSNTEDAQPLFHKQNASLLLNTPITGTSGMLLSYSILDSRIPLLNLGHRENQNRRNENFFIKYKSDVSVDTTLSLSGLYAPYHGDYFLKDAMNSAYQVTGGGQSLTGKLEHAGNFGRSEFNLSFRNSDNSRSGPDNSYNWRNTGSKDWGPKSFSKEGGYGDIDKNQQSITANLHYSIKPQQVGGTINMINLGFDAEHARSEYNRLTETSIHSVASANNNVDCNGDNSDCIDGEQFTWFKNIYPKDEANAELNNFAVYVEDDILIDRLQLRPGLRGSWDDFLENVNIAPRLAASFDLQENGSSRLIGGLNRYYGKNLLTLRLAEQKAPYTVWRRSTALDANNHPQPWAEQPRSTIPASRVSDLDTPYSDEWTLGLRQNLLGGLAELDYIDRQGHDLITTRNLDKDPVTKVKYSEWSNEGRNHHQQVSFAWSRFWQRQSLFIAATWQKTRGNSGSYTDSDADLGDQIWYNGEVGTKNELLVDDYNRPFRASLSYSAQFLSRFTFTNTTTYRSPYKSAEATGDTHLLPDGTPIDIYEDVSNDQALIFDWRLAFDAVRSQRMTLGLTLDIYNVFDQETNLGGSNTDYELGRQVWLGAECRF